MSKVGKQTQERVDATEPLTIKVTPGDAKNGVISDCHSCAIARSLKRQGISRNVSVGAEIVYVEREDGAWVRYVLSLADRKMVQAFDKLRYFRPGVYTLLPPPASKQLGARSGQPSGTNTRSGATKRHTQPTRVISAPR